VTDGTSSSKVGDVTGWRAADLFERFFLIFFLGFGVEGVHQALAGVGVLVGGLEIDRGSGRR